LKDVIELEAPAELTAIALPWVDYSRRETRTFAHGVTVAEIVTEMVPARLLADGSPIRVTVAGEIVEAERWSEFQPPIGSTPVIRVIPGGSNALRSVLLLSATIAATAVGQLWVGPTLLGAGLGLSGTALSVATSAATLGLITAATFLVNALVPARPSQAAGGSGGGQSATYSISGWRNPINPNGVFPLLFGAHRIAPSHINMPYREIVGSDAHSLAAMTAGYGPIVISDIRIKDTPIDRYKEAAYEYREGWPTDDPLSIYPYQIFQEDISVELLQEHADAFGPDSRWTASMVTSISIEVAFPAGLIAYGEVQQGEQKVMQQGPWSVAFGLAARLETDGGWTDLGEWSVSGVQQRPLLAAFQWDPPSRGRYEFRLRRNSDDWDRMDQSAQSWKVISRSLWTSITSYRPEYPVNTPFALVLFAADIRATEQLNGSIDEINFYGERYALEWNPGTGAWSEASSYSCASAFRFALQGPANARPVPDSKIDLERLQEWFAYCEPLGLYFNRYYDYPSSRKEVLADIAAAGRAVQIKRAGKWSVAWDGIKPTVSAYIGPRNSTNFSFKRVFVHRPDALRAKFKDETNNFEDAERLVIRPGFVGDPVVIEDVALPGITNPAIIFRELLRRLYEMEFRTAEYSNTMQYEAIEFETFDRVKVSHYTLAAAQKSARVTSVSDQCVTLDEIVEMEDGQDYAVLFRRPPDADGLPDEGLERVVTTMAGETNTLVLVGSGDMPERGDLAFFGIASNLMLDLIVKEIEPGDGMERHITYVDYAPQIFTLTDSVDPPAWNGVVGQEIDSDNGVPSVPVFGAIFSTAINPQTGSSTLYVSLSRGSGGGTVTYFTLQHRLFGAGSWTTVEIGANPGSTIISIYNAGDVVELRASAGGPGGDSAYSAVQTHTIGATDPVASGVASFTATQLNSTTWRFAFTTAPASSSVLIKYRTGHWTSWANLTSQLDVQTSSPYDGTTPAIVAATEYSFGARLVDASGIEVGTPIIIQVTAT
jgi:hypothetical protein